MLKPKQAGFTLIELLVSLVVASILLSGLITVYLTSTQKYRQANEDAQLDQTLQASLSFMASEIQRAGFWKNASSDVGANGNNNPFMANDITINAGGDCILFTYDKDGSGSLPSIGSGTDDKRYGFRLMSGAIQARPSGMPYSCAAAANEWENITNPNLITITQLSFVANNKTIDIGSGHAVVVRNVSITVAGHLISDASITKTLSRQVRVKNDKYS